jgi:hypothetical protein
MKQFLLRQIQALLKRRGYTVVETRLLTAFDKERASRPAADPPLAPGLDGVLRSDNPALADIRARYGKLKVDAAVHSLWNTGYVRDQVSLARFRGHSAYVWAYGELPRPTVLKYFIFAQYVQARARAMLARTAEDGAFGCLAYDFVETGRVSRDRLDSVLELDFLERHTGLVSKPGLRVMDVGAGYGRLAHRTCEIADVTDYCCLDAIAESTFLCDFYLKHRGIAGRARAVPLDEVVATPSLGRFDLAVNVHSWSECSIAAIRWWVDLVQRHEVPWLFVVPNQFDRFLSSEPDKSKQDFRPVIEAAGYRLVAQEPLFMDPDARRLVSIKDEYYLFQRA